jgi:CRP-like cAMP-binding protein
MYFATTPTEELRRRLDIALFADCDLRELRRIDSLATFLSVKAGRVLCGKGDFGRECFVLLDGYVDVDVNDCHHTVGRGAVLGEIALLVADGRRTATLTALSDSTLLVFTRTEFSQIMSGIPTVAHKVLRDASLRLLENNNPK